MIGLETWRRDASILTRAGDADLEPLSESEVVALVSEELVRDAAQVATSATWVYARWKPHVSLTTGWEVQFADGSTEVIGMKQYCGSKAKQFADRREFQTEGTERLRSHALLPERGLHLWTFPHDRMLPGLERLLDMRRTRRMIDDAGLFSPLVMRPGPSVLTPLRYKPERRGVFRLDARLRPEGGGARTEDRVAIRVLPIADAQRVAENRRACVAAGGGALLPRLLHYEERTGTLIEEWLDIETLARRDFSHAREAGELLSKLHALPVPAVSAPVRFQGSDLFEWHPELAVASAETYEGEPGNGTWIHGDLHPEQLARVGHGWKFLDLDGLALGDPLTDLATWIADKLTEPNSCDFSEASKELIAGYGAVDESELASRVAWELRGRAAGALRRLQTDAVETALTWLQRAREVAPKKAVSGFEAGLSSVARELAPLTLDQAVERVEVDRKSRLIVTAETSVGLRWFQRDKGRTKEVFPANDDRLPLVQSDLFRADQVISWRTGRRIVLRGSAGYLKGWRASRFENVVARHRRAQETGSFRIPSLVEVNADLACVTFEPIEGVPILEAPDVQSAFESVGRMLRMFQAGARTDLDTHSHQDELELLDTLSTRIGGVAGPAGKTWTAIRDRLGESVPQKTRTVLAHRDLHDGQFVWSEAGVGLLDFDLLCRADSSLDVANLCAHLKLRSLQTPKTFDPTLSSACRSAFLAGYSSFEGEAFESRVAFNEATTFLRLALLYSLRPRWSALVPALTRAADSCVRRLR